MTKKEKLTPLQERCKGMNLAELGEFFVKIRTELEEADSHKKSLQKQFDELRLRIVPEKMENENISSTTITGVGRLGLSTDAYAGIVSDKKAEAYQWLMDNGHGDLIVGTVNSSTIKSFLKTLYTKGEQFPDEYFRFEPFMRASITKL